MIPALWGVADAVWQTQLNGTFIYNPKDSMAHSLTQDFTATALYGVLFFNCQEEAFSNYRLWESLGFVIAFAYQGFVCVYVKLYVLLSVLVVGMGLYGVVEVRNALSTRISTF